LIGDAFAVVEREIELAVTSRVDVLLTGAASTFIDADDTPFFLARAGIDRCVTVVGDAAVIAVDSDSFLVVDVVFDAELLRYISGYLSHNMRVMSGMVRG